MTVQPLREPDGGLWEALTPLRGYVVETATLPSGVVQAVARSGRRTYRASGATRAAALRHVARLVAAGSRRQE